MKESMYYLAERSKLP